MTLAYQLGADSFLVKPVDFEKFIDCVFHGGQRQQLIGVMLALYLKLRHLEK